MRRRPPPLAALIPRRELAQSLLGSLQYLHRQSRDPSSIFFDKARHGTCVLSLHSRSQHAAAGG